MNIKKAIGAGLLVLAIQTLAMQILNSVVIPFLNKVPTNWVPTVQYAWQFVIALLLIVIIYCVMRWYFTGITATPVKGFYVGIVMAIVTLVVTLLPAIPALLLGTGTSFVISGVTGYLSSLAFWITTGVTIFAATLAGFFQGRNRAQKHNVRDAVTTSMPQEDTEKEDGGAKDEE